MEMSFKPMLPVERKYAYAQSQQISMQTGLIGYLRGDMDTDGEGFFTTWNDKRSDLKTDAFKTEFDEIINALRFDEQYGGVLSNRSSLTKYCRACLDSAFEGSYCTEYGFRADSEQYAYLFRLNPTKGDYNLYCFCYVRKWLDAHLERAAHGIRFITPDYKELFHIADGDSVRIARADGSHIDRVCRYIDDYHVEIGSNLYHICEFAERMEQAGNKVEPVNAAELANTRNTKERTGEAR